MTDFIVLKNPDEQNLISKIEAVLEPMGYGVRDLEINRKSSSICVLIEHSKKPEIAIGIQDCEKVHQILNPLFDVWDPIKTAYTLEISSPGEMPALRLETHFLHAVGQKVKFQTVEPLPVPPPAKPRKNWQGILKSVDSQERSFILLDDKNEFIIPINQVKEAQLIREWVVSKK